MQRLESLIALRRYVQENRVLGKTISFVPTMGALHDGHLELVRAGLRQTDICIPYIFINPKQFSPTEDLASYPKTLDADLEKLMSVGASAVYLPRMEDVYPDGFATTIKLGGVALPLEGEHRPHFFEGVATVVAKMLLQCLPDIALFGEKDYQQLLVIKKMTDDLNIPVKIIGVATVRDSSGLALSSRNAYLNDSELAKARQTNKILSRMTDAAKSSKNYAHIEKSGHDELLAIGFDRVDYITIRDADTLLVPDETTKSLRVLVAAWLGKARLIDNLPIQL